MGTSNEKDCLYSTLDAVPHLRTNCTVHRQKTMIRVRIICKMHLPTKHLEAIHN